MKHHPPEFNSVAVALYARSSFYYWRQTGPRGLPGGRRRTRHADSSEYRFVYLLPTWHYFL
ncbi:hypothetical protein [Streptomyces sp. NPDC004728]|uniref:hypothetical protein n=1 Tax=Streptomyces sp. NPDC004728 TaxID=3154289 RepID=UPI0033BB4E3A